MTAVDGFVVNQQIATHNDEITPEGSLTIEYIDVQLTVKYPKGFKPGPYKTDIEKALVRLMPAAYMELERRSA